ncbi:MAG: tRNA lysidine(34) synthetase TilS [Candidatus Pristimantibacillus lignocellulolyticus]|uniref:tRNA(Ile)-lysidine synthase n=1 Tax=Candidatus Pristimantibacillus lignocellulolyticus TaxID=2994561 RepID=A0A9J6ZIF2_9BACL|nr:MAG: tRNA lysidine(34) synthetase TilS [Candidatus Pristimantibacillus lignocellulolyticus]
MELVEEVWNVAKTEQLWEPGSTIVVAVSGGPDSMALLHILHSIASRDSLQLVVAHVNHGFRPEESAAEYQLVRQVAEQLALICEYTELDMPLYLEQNTINSQAASRQRRYAFLYEVCERHNAKYIALAHHGDDQAETVLMHILRGTGITGLSGMAIKRPEKNVELIRPLLRMRKDNLILYCQEEHISYLNDSSNEKRDYFRNEVRLDVIPYLQSFNPKLTQSLARLADVAGMEDDWMQQQANQMFVDHVKHQGQSIIINCKALLDAHVALQRRLIKLILSYLSQEATSISFEGIERIRWAAGDAATSTYRIDVGEGIVCVREYDILRFVHINDYSLSQSTKVEPLIIEKQQLPCVVQYGNWFISCKLYEGDAQLRNPASRYEAVFDYEAISFPLTIRSREIGDRMNVIGLNGSKKVQDMFVDAKIAVSERDTYPILQQHSGQIIWLPGVRRSSYGLVNEKTKAYIVITCDRGNHLLA